MSTNASIDRDGLLELTRSLVERPSENPPGDETGVASALVERLADSPIAFEVERYDVEPGRPNVVATAGDADGGTVLLSGHTDVVPADAGEWSGDPYRLRRRGDRVVGRGTADMKGALAAKVLAAEAYLSDSSGDDGAVVLAFVCDEEHEGVGTRALVERGLDADIAVIGEPTRLQVCTAQKGVVRYRITARGESAHTGTPERGLNAISGLDRVVRRLERFHAERRRETSHPLLAPETVTVTEIEGGIAPNVVPDTAELTVDWRLLPGGPTDPEPYDRRIGELISDLSIDGQSLAVTVERLVFARGAEIDPGHELVDATVGAATAAGVESEPVGFNAATDARFLVHDAGIPTVLFGPGSIEEDAHTVDESVRIDDLVATAKTYRNLLDRVLG
jgi:acetylornithine deacetylase/succinyl-diaminopimelate desuccinylase family protein